MEVAMVLVSLVSGVLHLHPAVELAVVCRRPLHSGQPVLVVLFPHLPQETVVLFYQLLLSDVDLQLALQPEI